MTEDYQEKLSAEISSFDEAIIWLDKIVHNLSEITRPDHQKTREQWCTCLYLAAIHAQVAKIAILTSKIQYRDKDLCCKAILLLDNLIRILKSHEYDSFPNVKINKIFCLALLSIIEKIRFYRLEAIIDFKPSPLPDEKFHRSEWLILKELSGCNQLVFQADVETRTSLCRNTIGKWIKKLREKGYIAYPSGENGGFCITDLGKEHLSGSKN